MLLDYRKVLRRPRQEVDKYLGSPVRTGGGDITYKTAYDDQADAPLIDRKRIERMRLNLAPRKSR